MQSPLHAFRPLRRTTTAICTIKACPGTTRTLVTPPWQQEVQTLHASRVLPYPSAALYKMISDIQSYSDFVPYCQSSNVTRWSTPDAKGRRWPRRADLQVGWGGLQENFSSRVYCVPGSVVEAVAGEAETTIASDQLAHYHGEADDEARMDQGGKQESIFKYLLTRWTVRPFLYKPPPTDAPPQDGNAMQPPRERTDVNLVIEYQFVNPVYGAMSKAVAPQLAGTMIEAFEKRASEVLAALR